MISSGKIAATFLAILSIGLIYSVSQRNLGTDIGSSSLVSEDSLIVSAVPTKPTGAAESQGVVLDLNETLSNPLPTFNHNPVQHFDQPAIAPEIEEDDLVYSTLRNTVPILNEEYKVVFFLVAKAASSEWLRFFIRLSGNPNWCSSSSICIHDRKENKLTYLSDYSPEEARKIMTSPEWTKAVFVRHPKPRLLSAFLDKAIEKSKKFLKGACRAYKNKGKDMDKCVKNHKDFGFFLNEITTTLATNVHWRSIYSRIDEKWWPYINFVGNMETLSDDAQTLLKSIKSNITGISAWDTIGTTGWSSNERRCEETIDSEGEFLSRRDKKHTTKARDKMLQYYTRELEEFVEQQYRDDLNNSYFHFEPISLFDREGSDRNRE